MNVIFKDVSGKVFNSNNIRIRKCEWIVTWSVKMALHLFWQIWIYVQKHLRFCYDPFVMMSCNTFLATAHPEFVCKFYFFTRNWFLDYIVSGISHEVWTEWAPSDIVEKEQCTFQISTWKRKIYFGQRWAGLIQKVFHRLVTCRVKQFDTILSSSSKRIVNCLPLDQQVLCKAVTFWVEKKKHNILLAFSDKYGVPTSQWTWLYEALLEVSMTK